MGLYLLPAGLEPLCPVQRLPGPASLCGIQRGGLSEEEYTAWAGKLEPVVKADYATSRDYWDGKKIKIVDDIQRWLMDAFLKSNRVSEGAQDYAGVVGMIMTMDRTL